LHGAALAVMDE